MVKVTIDRLGCISCGSCWEVCPAVFEENPDDTFSQVVKKFRTGDNQGEGEAPDEDEGCCHEAEELCPVQIIHIG